MNLISSFRRGRVIAMGLALLALLALVVLPGALEAQAAGSGPTQMRHFRHVFAAYAIAWVLLFGWAVSIARRIARVEKKLDDRPGA